MLSGDALGSVL